MAEKFWWSHMVIALGWLYTKWVKCSPGCNYRNLSTFSMSEVLSKAGPGFAESMWTSWHKSEKSGWLVWMTIINALTNLEDLCFLGENLWLWLAVHL